jgi:hypothetical protein
MEKIKSKRGRKPKNKNIQPKFINNKDDEDMPIIVHLPIKLNENNNFCCEKKVEPIKKQKIVKSYKEVFKIKFDNNSKCWWCRYSFDNEKVELPENYYNDYFYCIGNFCSYNCATAYNIDQNDENVFKRQSLLHLQYKKVYNEYKKIKSSPSWKILKEAGGNISIEEYRKNLITNDENYLYLKPPMISRISYIEKTSSQILMNENDYALRRTKPLKSKNYSLEQSIGLKILA